MTTPSIFFLGQGQAASLGVVGAKAYALDRMLRAGLPALGGLVVPADDAVGPEAAREALSALGALATGEPSASFAVRSSAPHEDGAAASYAGLHETFLGVTLTELPQRIREVARSSRHERVRRYREARGLEQTSGTIPVLVQLMADAVASGVVFTRDPSPQAHEGMVVVASLGLGPGVVDDLVPADTYRLDLRGELVHADVQFKHSRVSLLSGGGTAIVPTQTAQAQARVLDDGALRHLAKLALQVQTLFGGPQDIEWVIDEKGRITLLQARPMTTPAPQVELAWDNSNIVESFPDITSPLTFSFVRRLYRRTFGDALEYLGVSEASRSLVQPELSQLLGHHAGHVYYNLTHFRAVLSLLPGQGQNLEAWKNLVGIESKALRPSLVRRWSERVRMGLTLCWRLLDHQAACRRFFKKTTRALCKAEGIGWHHLSAHALWSALSHLEEELLSQWAVTLANDYVAMHAVNLLSLRTSAEGALDALRSSGDGNLASVDPLKALLKLRSEFEASSALRKILDIEDDEAAFAALEAEGTPEAERLRCEIAQYLKRYGHRYYEELKLEAKGLDACPGRVIGLIKRASMPHRSPAPSQASRWSLGARWLTGVARQALLRREKMRLVRARVFGVARAAFARAGAVLAEARLIECEADVYWLHLEEVEAALLGQGQRGVLTALVAARKAQLAAEPAPPPRFSTRGLVGRVHLPRRDSGADFGSDALTLKGVGCSGGTARGRVLIVRHPGEVESAQGRVLVTHSTDPAWVFLMCSAAAVVVERGSLLSHAAIVGRELGIPTVIGVEDAVARLSHEPEVDVDGTHGRIHVCARNGEPT